MNQIGQLMRLYDDKGEFTYSFKQLEQINDDNNLEKMASSKYKEDNPKAWLKMTKQTIQKTYQNKMKK
jgi:hypothetical protein